MITSFLDAEPSRWNEEENEYQSIDGSNYDEYEQAPEDEPKIDYNADQEDHDDEDSQ